VFRQSNRITAHCRFEIDLCSSGEKVIQLMPPGGVKCWDTAESGAEMERGLVLGQRNVHGCCDDRSTGVS
jgi:hypothetical protein